MKPSVFFVVFVTLVVRVRTEDEDEGPVVPPSSCEGMYDRVLFLVQLQM